jgi:hypothetical protein
MATPKQTAANKLNAQKSTGPKSPEGKAKSCLNNLSHGFASSTAQLIVGEDPGELKALLADLTSEYQPATPTEQILVEKMCQHQWLGQRAFRLQSDVLTTRIYQMSNIPRDLGVFIRYQSAAERNFHKAHTELVKAQEKREKSKIGFESQNDVQPAAEIPAPTPIAPEPPRETTVTAERSVPKPPKMPDFMSLEDELEDIMNAPVEEWAKRSHAEIKAGRKAA